MKKAWLAAVAASLLLTATACSGSGDDTHQVTEQDKQVISSMAGVLSKPTGGLLSASDAECVATKFVTDVGVDRLKAVRAVDVNGSYVADGALADSTTAASYAKAVLGCVQEDTVLTKLVSTSEAGYGAQTRGLLPAAKVHCLISKFVATTGVEQLFTSKFVTDTGEFTGPGDAFDEKTATDFVDAVVGCVDYPRLQAQLAAAENKKLSAAKLATCLAKRSTPAKVRATLIARLTGSPDATALIAANNAALVACKKASKK